MAKIELDQKSSRGEGRVPKLCYRHTADRPNGPLGVYGGKGGKLIESSLRDVKTFGWMDAADDSEYLDDCFSAYSTFRRIVKDPPLLVLGRKGTGKTAICERIRRLVSPNIFAEKLTFANYDWGRHESETAGLRPDQAWRYLILLTLSTMLIRDQSSTGDRESHERLESLIISTYGSVDVAFHQAFLPNRRLRLESIELSLGSGAKAGAKAKWDDFPMTGLPSIIDHLNQTLEKLIFEICNPEHSYYVLFDELDHDFRRGDEQYQRRLEALLSTGVNLQRRAKEAAKDVHVIIFLRSDIYDEEVTLPNEKNKITQDFTQKIDWSEPLHQRELKALMEKRFRAALKTPEATWEAIFGAKNVGYPPRSSFEFVLDHTMCRPRDIIQFSNCVLAAFQERATFSIDETAFTEEDMHDAAFKFGEYLYLELMDEAAERNPDLSLYFQMLKTLNLEKFYRSEFKNSYEQLKARLVFPQTEDGVLGRLFDLSVVGYRRSSPHKYIPEQYCFKYLESGARFDPNTDTYTVHEGLRAYLGRYAKPTST